MHVGGAPPPLPACGPYCCLALLCLTLHQLLLEGQVLPSTNLISSQLVNVEADVHPGASTHTQSLIWGDGWVWGEGRAAGVVWTANNTQAGLR